MEHDTTGSIKSPQVFDKTLERMRQSPTNWRCAELVKALEALGFLVREGSKGNHYVATHRGHATCRCNFNGGHGAHPKLLSRYVKQVCQVLLQFEEEIKAWISEQR